MKFGKVVRVDAIVLQTSIIAIMVLINVKLAIRAILDQCAVNYVNVRMENAIQKQEFALVMSDIMEKLVMKRLTVTIF